VDNFSTDQTPEICRRFKANFYQKGPERSVQRNYAVSKSKGEYVFILDSDMILTSKVIESCVDIFNNLDSQKVGGIVVPERSFGQGFWTRAKILEREIIQGESYVEAARFFPKKVFKEFDGYDVNITGPEDWDLPRRVSKKYKIGRVNEFILHNEGKQTLMGLAKRKYYYGLSAHKFLQKQRISAFSQETIYFLRPAFYRNWRKIVANPLTGLGMIIMLTAENVGGGLGYLVGRFKSDK
jgi:glycosyltransferase involved in cell wall biosynthesis